MLIERPPAATSARKRPHRKPRYLIRAQALSAKRREERNRRAAHLLLHPEPPPKPKTLTRYVSSRAPWLRRCPTCDRWTETLTQHHLVVRPFREPGQIVPTVRICRECHDYVHDLYGHGEEYEVFAPKDPDALIREVRELIDLERTSLAWQDL